MILNNNSGVSLVKEKIKRLDRLPSLVMTPVIIWPKSVKTKPLIERGGKNYIPASREREKRLSARETAGPLP